MSTRCAPYARNGLARSLAWLPLRLTASGSCWLQERTYPRPHHLLHHVQTPRLPLPLRVRQRRGSKLNTSDTPPAPTPTSMPPPASSSIAYTSPPPPLPCPPPPPPLPFRPQPLPPHQLPPASPTTAFVSPKRPPGSNSRPFSIIFSMPIRNHHAPITSTSPLRYKYPIVASSLPFALPSHLLLTMARPK